MPYRLSSFPRLARPLLFAAALPACAPHPRADVGTHEEDAVGVTPEALGASLQGDSAIAFRVVSLAATRIELFLYSEASGANERARVVLTRSAGGVWSTTVTAAQLSSAGLSGPVYYGYRAWGPNWPFDASWVKGSEAGFVADVDGQGNRFNPNKLLFDPYALELSHDPISNAQKDGGQYGTGAGRRAIDTGAFAPKGVVVARDQAATSGRPSRPLRDDIIYEVHARGLTMNAPDVPKGERGTYAGAARKADYLRSIGVTAVEFLPVQEAQNDQNDFDPNSDAGDNYWGYATLNYFAPERRYAADQSPGGPTREFRAMVSAFHDAGLKVYIDVVYNHTGEGGAWDATGDVAGVFSFRGLDNASYYELTNDNHFFYDNTGTGNNFNTASKIARNLIIDSLRYWKDGLGVDGFRFDLAPVLGNACAAGCFRFDKLDPNNALNRAVKELPVRPDNGGAGVDLIAEPWAASGNGAYQVGSFPAGWAEWNGVYRDTVRAAQNELGVAPTTPGTLATRFAGSSDLYGDDGRRPWHSINFLVAHDGFTLRDLYSYDQKNNGQPWPFGPSDGGTNDNRSWTQGGDTTRQRQAARTGFALLMLSAGVPMITGGDEMYRTQYGNNNAYNLDSPKNWLDWADRETNPSFAAFARRLMVFRGDHAALRPSDFFTGLDRDANGLKDITWYRDSGLETDSAYFNDTNRHYLAYRFDGSEGHDSASSIYVGYNWGAENATVTLPSNQHGKRWYRVADTAAWMENDGNAREPGNEDALDAPTYVLDARSLLLLIER